MNSGALVTYISIFGVGTVALAVIVTMLQHLFVTAPAKKERVL